MKSGKRSILQKMLYLHFMMMPVRHPFTAFSQENTPILRENQYNYIRLDSLNPPFQYSLRAVGPISSPSRRPEPMIPSFHCSIIPIAERSGARFEYMVIVIIKCKHNIFCRIDLFPLFIPSNPTFHDSIIPCGFSTSMATKNTIFPTSCRNSETSN
jgi:hypothetical protein